MNLSNIVIVTILIFNCDYEYSTKLSNTLLLTLNDENDESLKKHDLKTYNRQWRSKHLFQMWHKWTDCHTSKTIAIKIYKNNEFDVMRKQNNQWPIITFLEKKTLSYYSFFRVQIKLYFHGFYANIIVL